MVTCERCYKDFQYPWLLRRHLARKKICTLVAKDSEAVAKDSEAVAKDSEAVAKDSGAVAKDSGAVAKDSYECRYCCKQFKRLYTMRQHEAKCNDNDEIWILENKCQVVHKVRKSNQECKYCNIVFTRANNMPRHTETCKMREQYKHDLEKRLESLSTFEGKQVANTINNNNTTNNTTNNTQNANVIVNVNSLGNENLEHITLDKIESIIRRIIEEKYPGDNNLYKLSAQTVVDVHKLIREKDENRNVIIPHERRQFALVKRNERDGFVKEGVGEILDDSFKNTSRKIYNIGKGATWTKKKAEKIHKCVGSFGRKGFRGHPEMPNNSGQYEHRRDDLQSARRKYKMANMLHAINEENDDEL